jgi:CheY-like chemotaxis protein
VIAARREDAVAEAQDNRVKSILVVEDEMVLAEMLRLVFEDAGYRVSTAANGREALKRLEQERPDLVLSDVMMPVLDGHGLYAALQAGAAQPPIPIVLMSAAGPRVLRTDERPAAFIQKPFDVDQLLATVAAIIGSHGGSGPAPSDGLSSY